MSKKLPRALVATAALLFLAACTAAPGASSSDSNPSASAGASAAADTSGTTGTLDGHLWLAYRLNGAEISTGSTVTATFAADGHVSGSSGCNSYSGKYTTSGSGITITPTISTKVSCAKPILAQEAAFLAALKATKEFAFEGGRLALRGDGGKELAALLVQTQEIVGTAWKVSGLNNGKAVAGVLAGTTASVNFSKDKVTGNAGCNTFQGALAASAGGVKMGPFASTKLACATPKGVMEQETKLLAALEAATTFTVVGNTLELRNQANAVSVTFTR